MAWLDLSNNRFSESSGTNFGQAISKELSHIFVNICIPNLAFVHVRVIGLNIDTNLMLVNHFDSFPPAKSHKNSQGSPAEHWKKNSNATENVILIQTH